MRWGVIGLIPIGAANCQILNNVLIQLIGKVNEAEVLSRYGCLWKEER